MKIPNPYIPAKNKTVEGMKAFFDAPSPKNAQPIEEKDAGITL